MYSVGYRDTRSSLDRSAMSRSLVSAASSLVAKVMWGFESGLSE